MTVTAKLASVQYCHFSISEAFYFKKEQIIDWLLLAIMLSD
jgi:hypothetical protein